MFFSRSKLGHKITFLQILTYLHYSITVKRDSLFPNIYLSSFSAKSASKGPRYKAFKSDTSGKILLYMNLLREAGMAQR